MLYFLILLKNKLNGETVEATILKDEQSGKSKYTIRVDVSIEEKIELNFLGEMYYTKKVEFNINATELNYDISLMPKTKTFVGLILYKYTSNTHKAKVQGKLIGQETNATVETNNIYTMTVDLTEAGDFVVYAQLTGEGEDYLFSGKEEFQFNILEDSEFNLTFTPTARKATGVMVGISQIGKIEYICDGESKTLEGQGGVYCIEKVDLDGSGKCKNKYSAPGYLAQEIEWSGSVIIFTSYGHCFTFIVNKLKNKSRQKIFIKYRQA